MKNRPKPQYVKILRREDPPVDIRGGLISVFGDGGCDIEARNVADLGSSNKITCLTELRSRELNCWRYVGDLWWCRHIKRKDVFEFARYVAFLNDKDCDQVVGLWRESLHGFREPPVVVYYNGRKGQISAFSEFEIYVQWWEGGELLSGRVFPDPGRLEFEFIEDEKYYSGIIANIKR